MYILCIYSVYIQKEYALYNKIYVYFNDQCLAVNDLVLKFKRNFLRDLFKPKCVFFFQ